MRNPTIGMFVGDAEIERRDRQQQSMDFEYCPACSNELDTGYECLTCGRDWRPWATLYLNVTEVDGDVS